MAVISHDGLLRRTLPCPVEPGDRHRLRGVTADDHSLRLGIDGEIAGIVACTSAGRSTDTRPTQPTGPAQNLAQLTSLGQDMDAVCPKDRAAISRSRSPPLSGVPGWRGSGG